MDNKKTLLPISIYYSLIYMSVGAFTSYIGLYYADINLGNTEIGILTSLGAATTIIAQPIWGTLGDRSVYKNRVLALCLFFTCTSIWLIPFSGNVLSRLSAVSAVFYFFQCAVNPLSDTITLELSSKKSFKFSTIRTIGSFGYAIMSAIAGRLFDSDINRIFPVFSVLMLSALMLSFLIPPVEGHQQGRKKVQLFEIFKNKKLVSIYMYTFIVQVTMGFFYSFHAIYSKQQGISTQLIGFGVMVGSFSQFPFMIFFDKIYKRFGIKDILIASGVIHALRWILYATALTPATIVFLWVLHGCTYIVFYLCLAEYVNNNVIKELKASGQMMNSLVIQGISKVIGGLFGGILASLIGIRFVFAASAVISVVAVIVFYIVFKVPESDAEVEGLDVRI